MSSILDIWMKSNHFEVWLPLLPGCSPVLPTYQLWEWSGRCCGQVGHRWENAILVKLKWCKCFGANAYFSLKFSRFSLVLAVLRKVTAFLCQKYLLTQSNKRSKFLTSNITRWARAECSRRGEESSASGCREKLHGVQYLIRCRSFSNIDLICTIVSIAQVKNLKLHWLLIILSPGQLWSALYLTL